MQDEHIDWEAMMKAAGSHAKQANRNSERTLGGIAQALRNQKTYAAAVSALGDSQQELKALLLEGRKEQQRTKAPPSQGKELKPRLWPIILLSSAVAASIALSVSGMS